MIKSPTVCMSVHGPILSADAKPDISGCVSLEISKGGGRINFFTGNGPLAAELAEAVNAVLAKHRQPIAEAAE